jgi:SAM-dependent methyltransferase
MADHEEVAAHYERGGLLERILAAAATGLDPEHLGPDDLAGVEEFHTLGRPATLGLAAAAAIGPDDHVLDAGGGLGGPARTLVRTTGCRVTMVDITPEFCEVARELNRRSGLDDRITVREANALDIPFDDGSFDVAWTQHVSMNIADKAALYRELRRLVTPEGRLAFFDVIAGPVQPLRFPVPWAEEPDRSFLVPADGMRTLVTEAGFSPTQWEDASTLALDFFNLAAVAASGPPPPLSLHLLMDRLPEKMATMRRNLEEERIRLLRCVAVTAGDGGPPPR